MTDSLDSLLVLGWREWVALPELKLPKLKAKVDTGARTAALHAFEVTEFSVDGRDWVRFRIHPKQRDLSLVATCEAAVVDRRVVTDSGGHSELRHVIRSPLQIGDASWPIEITLTNRDDMRFRMLLGRTSIRGRAVVDPQHSYLTKRPKKFR